MVLVRARVRLSGEKGSYSSEVLVDTDARMSLVDRPLAERVGVEYTGRRINFVSVSGHTVKASEAIIPELELDGEVLKYDAVAVADIPGNVKKALKNSGLDENIIIGLLTLERANMIPDTTAGKLRKVESFILMANHIHYRCDSVTSVSSQFFSLALWADTGRFILPFTSTINSGSHLIPN